MAAPKRPFTKLNARVHAGLVKACRKGLHRSTAAALVGVGSRTFYTWLEQGESEAERGENTPQARLWLACQMAEAEFEEEMLELIAKAAKDFSGNWAAAMTVLERKYPERFGKRDALTVDFNKPLIELNVSSDSEASTAAIALFERLAAISEASGTSSPGIPRALSPAHPDIDVPHTPAPSAPES